MSKKYLDETGMSYAVGKVKALLNGKQNTLTAGDNITIVNDVISASGGLGDTPIYYEEINSNQYLYNKSEGMYFYKNIGSTAVRLNVGSASNAEFCSVFPNKIGVVLISKNKFDGAQTEISFIFNCTLRNYLVNNTTGAVLSTNYMTTPYNTSNTYNTNAVLTTTNTNSYTPINNYNPATKKYVDDKFSEIPTASDSTLGMVKVGTGLSIDANGVLSAFNNVPVYYIETDETYRMYDDDKNAGVYIIKNTSQSAIDVYCAGSSKYAKSIPAGKEGIIFVEDYSADKKRLFFFKGDELKNVTISSSGGIYGSTSYVIPALLNSSRASSNSVLSIENGVSYTPTSDYHPATKKYVDDAVATKQNTLTAGDNITIENNVISATGGGGGTEYTAGKYIDITNNVIDLYDKIVYSTSSSTDVGRQSSAPLDFTTLSPGKYVFKNNGSTSTFYYRFKNSAGETTSRSYSTGLSSYNLYIVNVYEDMTEGLSNVENGKILCTITFVGVSEGGKTAYFKKDTSSTYEVITGSLGLQFATYEVKTAVSSLQSSVNTLQDNYTSLDTRVTTLEEGGGSDGSKIGENTAQIQGVNPLQASVIIEGQIEGVNNGFIINIDYNVTTLKTEIQMYTAYAVSQDIKDVALMITDDDGTKKIFPMGTYTSANDSSNPLEKSFSSPTLNIMSQMSTMIVELYYNYTEPKAGIKEINLSSFVEASQQTQGLYTINTSSLTEQIGNEKYAIIKNDIGVSVDIEAYPNSFTLGANGILYFYYGFDSSNNEVVILEDKQAIDKIRKIAIANGMIMKYEFVLTPIS